MQATIKCSTTGCSNPVIGQCPGYNKSCGKFYCETHTDGTYCGECSRVKAEEIKAKEIFDDYLRTAKSLRLEAFPLKEWLPYFIKWVIAYFIIAFIPFVILGIMSVLSASSGEEAQTANMLVWMTIAFAWLCLISIVSIGIFAIAMNNQMNHRLSSKLTEVEIDRPGFSRFFRAWEKERNKKIFVDGLKIAGIIAVAMVGAIIEDAVERDRIRRGVDEALRKHGY